MKSLVRKHFPRPLQSWLRRMYYHFPLLRKLYYLPVDLIESLAGNRGKIVPARSQIFIGDSHFEATGNEFFNYFKNIGDLQPDETVLEVGCGIGRMALPLTRYLDSGRYEGIDIVTEGISWCRKNISSEYSNFHFQVADIYNTLYNPRGKYNAVDYRFPFADSTFDFVFLTSVFTHMVLQEVDNYLGEISRVLKKEGRCFATFFLLDAEARKFVSRKDSKFHEEHEGCRVIDKSIPEASIAFEENKVRELFSRYGLEIKEPIHYGSWAQRKQYLSSQDIVLAFKR